MNKIDIQASSLIADHSFLHHQILMMVMKCRNLARDVMPNKHTGLFKIYFSSLVKNSKFTNSEDTCKSDLRFKFARSGT